MHVGKSVADFKCQSLVIDNWKEVEIFNEVSGIDEVEDICNDDLKMEEASSEKYLGDILSVDGKNINNIKARVAKATGIISRILSILDGIPFGQYYFEVAIILRNTLLLSSILCNSESWYNVTQAELNLLESADLQFFRRILNVPKSTPKEMFYLEFGCTPLRYIVKKRRILFLHYILNQDPDSMIYRFLMTQMKNRKKQDWSTQVLKDLEDLKVKDDLQQIKQTKKLTFKNMIEKAITETAFQELQKQKVNHSKVKDIKHQIFQMQKYLKACNVKITKEEAQEIFKLRSRVTDVKCNFKGKFDNLECDGCKMEDESQQHIILNCKILSEKHEGDMKYEDIFDGNVRKKVEIAKQFISSLKNREKIRAKKE